MLAKKKKFKKGRQTFQAFIQSTAFICIHAANMKEIYIKTYGSVMN